MERLAFSVKTRKEGLFLPLLGSSGIGKSTFANNINFFYPLHFSQSIQHMEREITFTSLCHTVEIFKRELSTAPDKIIPIVIDHRESAPPTQQEMSEIKRFLRLPSEGHRCLILWPETNEMIANTMSQEYINITGKPAIPLPVNLLGPDRGMWKKLAKDTMEICNNGMDLSELGIDPETYDIRIFNTLGEYLRQISNDFGCLFIELINQTVVPTSLNIIFVSNSQDAGVLTQLTSSTRFGLLDGHALIASTPQSRIGLWWSNRRGLLIQTIFRLNAHTFCLTPTPTLDILVRYSEDRVKTIIKDSGITDVGDARICRDLSRSDLGKYLDGIQLSAMESRGTPAVLSSQAFTRLSNEFGFVSANDKVLNRAIKEGLFLYINRERSNATGAFCETKLEHFSLIPDIYYTFNDNSITTFELTWRTGNFLEGNRSVAAQFILTKLRDYATAFGWVAQ